MNTLRWDLHRIDESSIGDHHWLSADDDCYYFHEYTPKKGFSFSPANQYIFNFKMKVRHRQEARYRYKTAAIEEAARRWKKVLGGLTTAELTLAPIPPSKIKTHPEFDDRVMRAIRGAATGTNAEVRELILQTESYAAAHEQEDGHRIRPEELQPLYKIAKARPRSTVILFDDMLTTGCHFVAAKAAIREQWPDCTVLGFFLARRVPSASAYADLFEEL